MRALVYVDADKVKFAWGNAIKSIPKDQMGTRPNQDFIVRLFAKCEVFMVTKVAKVADTQKLKTLLAGGGQEELSEQEPAPPQDLQPNVTQKREQQTPPGMAPRFAPRLGVADVMSGKASWLKASKPWAIVIDDLPTFEELQYAPGCKKNFSIPAGAAANLALCDLEDVRKSRILKTMLDNGTVQPITADEALQIEQELQQKELEREEASGDIIKTSVEKYISGDGSHEATTVDFTDELIKEQQGQGGENYSGIMLNEGAGTMSELMSMLDSEADGEVVEIESIEEAVQPRQRPGRPATSNSAPRISRA